MARFSPSVGVRRLLRKNFGASVGVRATRRKNFETPVGVRVTRRKNFETSVVVRATLLKNFETSVGVRTSRRITGFAGFIPQCAKNEKSHFSERPGKVELFCIIYRKIKVRMCAKCLICYDITRACI